MGLSAGSLGFCIVHPQSSRTSSIQASTGHPKLHAPKRDKDSADRMRRLQTESCTDTVEPCPV